MHEFEVLKAIHDVTGRQLVNNGSSLAAEQEVLGLLEWRIEAAADKIRHFAHTGCEPASPPPSPVSFPPSSPPPSSPTMVGSSEVDYSDYSPPAYRPAARMSTGGKRRADIPPLILPPPAPTASSSHVTLEESRKRPAYVEDEVANKRMRFNAEDVIDLTGDDSD
ncbi:hypothetical protein PM082_022321 [Marasmius tenuissimus]|nr:hypothetical protein PM082_022321 [Marasmius tenuissimus]